jgi:MFS family permease
MTWPRALGALSSRNYRLYFIGQIISLVGTFMTQTASLWLVYKLSASPMLLGMVGFASQAPIFFMAPFAGVWVDRMNRHRLLIFTQVMSMFQSLALALLTYTNHINAHSLIALCLVQGLINGLDMPTRQALVISFVERKEHLGNAIALNSSLFNLARLAGPALAGFVISAFGAAACYFIDSVSYLAVIISLLSMRIALPVSNRPKRHPWIELREGFDYAFKLKPIRVLIVALALVSFVGFSYAVLTPMFAHDVFAGNAKTLGYLMSASGVGAVMGAAYLGMRTTIRGLGNVMAVGGGLMGAGLMGFSLSRWLPLSLFWLAVVGLGGVLLMASGNTLLQSLVDEDKRGRVMSIYTMAFSGTMPLGNLAIGAIAEPLGAPLTLALTGVVTFLIAFGFYRKLPQLRLAAAPLLSKMKLAET